MQIIPVVMEKNWVDAEQRLLNVYLTSKWVQADITDNEMVQGKSFEMELLESFEFSEKMLWDIHLLVKEPKKWLEKCIFIGATRITGQVEMMTDREEFVKAVKDEGLEAGIGFDIETPISEVPEETDMVLLMTRKAGYVPMDIDQRIWEKIKKVKEVRDGRESKFLIGVDGGVNLENVNRFKEAGVDVVYSEKSYFDLINADN